jgi:hypothetical protein
MSQWNLPILPNRKRWEKRRGNNVRIPHKLKEEKEFLPQCAKVMGQEQERERGKEQEKDWMVWQDAQEDEQEQGQEREKE